MSISLMLALALTPAPARDEGYPKIITEKALYAKNDLRGKKAPDFKVEKWFNKGETPSLKGKTLYIDFWATWCGPCRQLIPEINAMQKKFSKDVVFIGISDETSETLKAFLEKTKVDYWIATDTQARMKSALGVQGIPHVMIVSPDGIVRWQGFPGSQEDPLTEKVVEQIVKASKNVQKQ